MTLLIILTALNGACFALTWKNVRDAERTNALSRQALDDAEKMGREIDRIVAESEVSQ